MDKIDHKMDQFLADLDTLRSQLIRVKGAAAGTAYLEASDTEDIRLKVDALVARLQLS